MIDFWEGQYDVLVCTTIIESGIDMPTVNTLVVDRADLLGLGQLHQLRGRVGRSGQRAYAYLFHPPRPEPHRGGLRAAEDHRRGHRARAAGFKIAMRDLEIRGAGNLLGDGQSGHIAAVGYDLYCQMVTEAVAELKGEEVREPAEVKLDLPVDAHLPKDYVAKEELRLEAYRRLAAVTTDGRGRRHPGRVGGPLRAGARAGRAPAHHRPAAGRSATASASATCRSPATRPASRPLRLRASETMRLRRLARDAIYKEEAGQLVVPLRRGEDPAGRLVALLTELVPEPERAASA